MIDTILEILKSIAAILPVILLCLATRKINLEKNERSRQFPMPVIALVYVIAAMILMDSISDWLLQLINNLPLWVASLAGVSWMPEVLSNGLIKISSWLAEFLRSLNLAYWIFFIANAAIVLVYLVLKKFCIGIIRRAVKSDGKWHTKIASHFYRFFFERNFWCLKDSYTQVRSFLKLFYYSALVLSSVLMLLSAELYKSGALQAVFYPVFGILIMGELYFYLDGRTQGEYGTVMGEDDAAYRMVNYSLLRKFLRNLFKDKLLVENTGLNSALTYSMTTDDILRELEKDEDQKITSFAAYVKALNQSGFPIDHNYLYSSLDLLRGKSILFNNPFYKDLIPYAFYPMNRALLSHQKVLVVLGRHAIEEDIRDWIEQGIGAVTNIPFMWDVQVLDKEAKNPDIGILTRSDVLDISLHNANADFLEDVGFVVIIEPSKLITTAQIGLNLLIKQCRGREDKELVYCLCDKNCDGLVDAMSHILMTSFTEVSATNKHRGTSSYMCWEADKDYLHHRLVPNISRYLGMGTELSFAALKNQIAKTEWYGGEAFPVTDMRWIDRQYYYDLTRYAGLPTNQESMDEFFRTSPNFWSAGVEKNNYFTVEDEFCNMFEILRAFSTRTSEQGFINVISPEYLLKDYMADNAPIFETDAKAIPYIVADHTRSHRNTMLRLLLMMCTKPVSTAVLERELSLLGITVYDLPKQLWYELYQCFATVGEISDLSGMDYKAAVEQAACRHFTLDELTVEPAVFVVQDIFNLRLGQLETTYTIGDAAFAARCMAELRSASYVAEDEKGQQHYLGAELSGHIYQKYLPGQFFTFGGKYYEMQYLTADGQILVRRAADHINGRPAYRQIRQYTLLGIKPSDRIGASRDVAGMKVIREFADIRVDTPGYYRMERYNDFATAKKVLFEGHGIPTRIYRNKELLRIELPQVDGMPDSRVLYTVTMLFNELFKTLFAENQAFICAVTAEDFAAMSGVKPVTYAVSAEGCQLQDNSIYIIEDSQLDLGLTVAVERNLQRILEIMHDYLDWHNTTLELSLDPPAPPPAPVIFTDEEAPKKSLVGRVIDRIRDLFKKKPKAGETPAKEPPAEDTPAEDTPTGETPTEDTPADEVPADNTPTEENAVPGGTDGMGDNSEKNAPGESEFQTAPAGQNDPAAGIIPPRKPYHERYFLLFGGVNEPACIDQAATKRYLAAMGLAFNPLRQAREGKNIARTIEATFKPGKPNARYCDFCGTEIFGVEYETLADGRDRCLHCGRTAIKSGQEFKKIFEDVKRNMESFFGIRLNVGVRVEMVNSKTLHKRLGDSFTPTPRQDGRVLGVAIKDRTGFSLLVENGSPRMSSILTMAHELTHIWQYVNWNSRGIRRKYGKRLELEVYEGMAKWVEVQYAYLINEPAVAKRTEILTAFRDDEYGRGFLRYRANYPFSTGTVLTRDTPFMDTVTPLAPDYCGNITVIVPKDDGTGLPGEDDDTTGGNGGNSGNGGAGDNTPPPSAPTATQALQGPIQRDPDGVPAFAYEQLSVEEKKVYDLFLQAIRDFQPGLTNLPVTITAMQARRIVDFILTDHPELYWFYYNDRYEGDPITQRVVNVYFDYRMTPEEAQKRQAEIEAAVRPFLDSISDNMSDFEVVQRVYENIIQLVDYDTVGLERQKKMPRVARKAIPDDLRSIYGVFVDKKAVCAGYAKAMQFLLNLLGIECTYVTSQTHAWNLVKLEGDYYHMDVTWGDGSNTLAEKNATAAVDYGCFCITTEELLRLDAHTPEDILQLPVCTAVKCNYHHRHGLFFDTFDYDRLRRTVCESVAQGKREITFKFASEALFDKALHALVEDGKFAEALRFANLKNGTQIDLQYMYVSSPERRVLNFYLKTV